MALKDATQNKPVEQPRRWPFDYSTEEIKNSLGGFEQLYQGHATGALVHNDILGMTPQGVIDWLFSENIILEKDGAWFICYYPYQSWSSKYRGMREIQSRRAFAKRKELQSLDKEVEKVADDMSWLDEEKEEIDVSKIPF